MMIVYDSRTGNVKRFVSKLNMPAVSVDNEMIIEEPFVLVTYTTGFGQAPENTLSFLERNHTRLVGVSASGNRNWGQGFARSADRIAEMYRVPIISKFELAGTMKDVESFVRGVNAVAAY
ncbi:class Ib ribonucleoside-diphosphate reductase assembly flavoprotein NrdI [Paenibacillus ginsengarvi]|uniref:Protein NrdI n=1 Tax=Paenibacillus ginsengarvi TaxID=400777 RepID=A0A3B0CIS7_9BACL|nr:class Ib ribonucleoside-diphosphate reductase assembly flavoprotein NrdI [Paenibacillus ginsengarvi]RKN84209.1 class Ib ribonucleoside-diphosphate reductase assembly flavoprotein NrdI [Paenibacillus ginsengarvi]